MASGATASTAAARVIPAATPKTAASTVYGPPRAGSQPGSEKRTSAPRWLSTKLKAAARSPATAAATSGRRARLAPALASSTVTVEARTPNRYPGLVVVSTMARQATDQAATARGFTASAVEAVAGRPWQAGT